MSNRTERSEMVTLERCSALERALAFSIGKEKSRECVNRLLERYGSISTVFSESEEELCRIGGINMNTALLIKLIAYSQARRITDNFKFGEMHTELELREFIGALFLGASVETVYVLLLDEAGRVISAEHISEGTVNASDIIPRKILACANKKRAKTVVLAHNHPKGNKLPSKDDVMTTGRLFNLLSAVGVRLAAHYIVADGDVGRIETDMLYDPDIIGRAYR